MALGFAAGFVAAFFRAVLRGEDLERLEDFLGLDEDEDLRGRFFKENLFVKKLRIFLKIAMINVMDLEENETPSERNHLCDVCHDRKTHVTPLKNGK